MSLTNCCCLGLVPCVRMIQSFAPTNCLPCFLNSGSTSTLANSSWFTGVSGYFPESVMSTGIRFRISSSNGKSSAICFLAVWCYSLGLTGTHEFLFGDASCACLTWCNGTGMTCWGSSSEFSACVSDGFCASCCSSFHCFHAWLLVITCANLSLSLKFMEPLLVDPPYHWQDVIIRNPWSALSLPLWYLSMKE